MSRKKSRKGVPVNGMLLLDKPVGISSNQALQQAKRLLNARKAGHTGSLDPVATGILPLCFGETTKISSMFLDADKEYRVAIQLGVATNTGDSEGEVIHRGKVDIDQQQLDEVLDQFRGEYEQVPPMYSALKLNGQPLYKLARKGIEVERQPRKVRVYALTLDSWQDDTIELTVACSRGFYIRTLAMDIGSALGCGGYVTELRRTGVGQFNLDQVVTLDQLEMIASPQEREKLLMPTDVAIGHLPKVSLPENIAFYLCRGQSVRALKMPDSGLVRVYSESEEFLGIGEVTREGKVAPKRLFIN